jgi:glycosyltransferase involved in cell wall biosynthesis
VSAAARAFRRIIMVGTAFETRGGIAAVVNAYRANGLFERWPVEYVVSHGDGSFARKLRLAAQGAFRYVGLLARPGGALVHVHLASRASFWRKSLFMALALAANARLVLHLHGGGFARFYAAECGGAGRRLVRFFLVRAVAVIVLSERWARWVRSVAGEARIVCLPNPVSAAPAGAAGHGPGNTVLFMGRPEHSKGLFDLLEVLARLRSCVPDIRLVCAGDGDLGAARACAERLGIADRVVLTGWLGAEAKARWMNISDVFVLPSYAEGMPMSLLEAMAAGMPVLATAVGGIPDVITEGVNGVLAAPGDRAMLERLLLRLLSDRALRARLGAAARETARLRFAADQCIGQLESLYRELGVQPTRAARHGGPAPTREAA